MTQFNARQGRTFFNLRYGIPSGYFLGRVDAGEGPAQLIAIDDVIRAAGGGKTNVPAVGFGFYDGGRLNDHELLGAATFSRNVKFPGSRSSTVTAVIPASAMAVFTMVDPTLTTVGTITFAAGSTTGVIAWSPSPYTLAAGQPLQLYAPTPADPALAFISGLVNGSFA